MKYRLGGRGSRRRYGGSFTRKAEARVREAWINSQLAAMRVPDLRLVEPEPVVGETLTKAAERWRASRIDVSEETAKTYTVNLNRILPVLGPMPIDDIRADDVQRLVNDLHAEGKGLDRESIRKTRSTLAQILGNAEVVPNPARDPKVKLPREEPEQLDPPTADHIEACLRAMPTKYVLPVLWLDWSAHRVTAGVDKVTVGDWDLARGRVRARAATTKTRRAHWARGSARTRRGDRAIAAAPRGPRPHRAALPRRQVDGAAYRDPSGHAPRRVRRSGRRMT